jgi:hypothetical protein
MTANNVLHSCSPGTKCAIQIAAPAFEPRLEATLVDLVEKHEPCGGVSLKNERRPVDGQTAIREGRYQSQDGRPQGRGDPAGVAISAISQRRPNGASRWWLPALGTRGVDRPLFDV